MSMHPPPPTLHRRHWYAYVIVGVPDQVPVVTPHPKPGCFSRPGMSDGAMEIVGATAPTTSGLTVVVAVREPPRWTR